LRFVSLDADKSDAAVRFKPDEKRYRTKIARNVGFWPDGEAPIHMVKAGQRRFSFSRFSAFAVRGGKRAQ
jgi:hypothetical protein